MIHPWPALAWWLLDRVLPGLLVSTLVSVIAVLRLRVAQQRADERHEDLKAHVTAVVTGAMPPQPARHPEEPVSTPPSAPPAAPHWGFTRHHGLAVHARTADHLPAGSGYQRFNKRMAIGLQTKVGTMTCFWIFNGLSFLLLAPTLAYDGLFRPPAHGFLHWYLSYGFIILWTFLLSTYLQLVLLPGLMVGQALQNAASDARTAKQFEDTEVIADRLDTRTQGGITEILHAIEALRGDPDGGV